MPHGKGTYGSKVGRPAKKSPMNKNGDPKKKIKSAGKFQSRAEARENIKNFGKGEGRGKGAILSGKKSAKDAYKEAGKKVDMVKDVAKNPMPKGKPTAIDKARAKSPMNMNYGPRSEGKRGKGTGWAN